MRKSEADVRGGWLTLRKYAQGIGLSLTDAGEMVVELFPEQADEYEHAKEDFCLSRSEIRQMDELLQSRAKQPVSTEPPPSAFAKAQETEAEPLAMQADGGAEEVVLTPDEYMEQQLPTDLETARLALKQAWVDNRGLNYEIRRLEMIIADLQATERTLKNEVTMLKAALQVVEAQYHLEKARREHFYTMLSCAARKDDRDYYTVRRAVRCARDFMDEIKEDVLWDAAVAE